MNKSIKNQILKYLLFTICFWIFIGPLIYNMSEQGLASFGGWDAITQIYQVMLYTSRIIKEFFSTLFSGGDFSFPMVDWNLGMGDDVIAALNWHGFGDPFYLLTVFVQEENLPYFFSVLFYLRVYLGGIAFIAFAYELNNEKSDFAYVIGALLYCFTGFTVQCNMHLIFVHAMMYIPLLLLGAERVIQSKKKGVLCITVFLFALSGFFYLYIGSVSLAVYVIYRFIRRSFEQGSCQFKKILGKIGEMLAEYIIGLGLASVIFVPAAIGFFSSNRASVKVNVPAFMSWAEIKTFWLNFFLPQYENDQVLSMCTVGVMCVLFTILAQKKYVEKVNVTLLFLCSCIPLISVAMSGFGECYDRWEVVVTLYFSYLVVELWDELDELSWSQKIGSVIVFAALGIIGKKLDILEHERYNITLVSYAMILTVLLVILPLFKKINKREIGYVILFIITVVTIAKDWKGIARDREIAYVQERDVVSELVSDKDDFYRIDNERTWSEPRNGQNIALTLGYNGISEYISIENPSFTNGMVQWNVSPDAFMNHMNVGLDARGALETLSCVKYLIKREDVVSTVPYGFNKVKVTADGQWSLYQNEYALPIVYSYDKIFDEVIYQNMNGFDKQQVMLQSCAAEDYNGELDRISEFNNSINDIKYSIDSIEGGSIEDNVIKLDDGGKLTLTTNLKASGENYLLFQNVDFNNSITITVQDGLSKGLSLTSDYHNGNIGANLGVVNKDEDRQITLSFQNAETFDLSRMKILNYDYNNYDSYIKHLREESLTKLMVNRNRISCSVDLDKRKILCIASPYSKGWTAYIDGEKVNVYRVNDMFMGIEVSEGRHDIVLKYKTSGLNFGMVLSAVSSIAIILYIIYNLLLLKKIKE